MGPVLLASSSVSPRALSASSRRELPTVGSERPLGDRRRLSKLSASDSLRLNVRLAELAAGLPDGVPTSSPATAMLTRFHDIPDVDVVNFTTACVGRIIGNLAGQNIKKAGLELGGKGPQVCLRRCPAMPLPQRFRRRLPCPARPALPAVGLSSMTHRDSFGEIEGALAAEIVTGTRWMMPAMSAPDPSGPSRKVAGYVAAGKTVAPNCSSAAMFSQAGAFRPDIFTRVRPEMSIAGRYSGRFCRPFKDPQQAVQLANNTLGLSATAHRSSNLSTAIKQYSIKAGAPG